MRILVEILWHIQNALLDIVRSAIDFVLGVVTIILYIPKVAIGGFIEGMNRTYDRNDINERLLVPTENTAPELELHEAITSEIADLIKANDWDEALKRIRTYDQERTAMPGLKPYFELGTHAARLGLTKSVDAFEDQLLPGLSGRMTKELDRLEKIRLERPDDYVIAAIVAQSHIDIGWAFRGCGFIDEVSPSHLRQMGEHFSRARELLDQFDSMKENSPLLASTRYGLAVGLDDGERHFRGWYEDWTTLCPTHLRAYLDHSFNLLPRWFGSHQELEIEARKAVSRSFDILGNGAYPFFYFNVLDYDWDELLLQIDHDMFFDGVIDILERTNSQYLVNSLAWSCVELSRPHHSAFELSPPRNAFQERMKECFHTIIKQHLHVLYPALWEDGINGALWEIAAAFDSELTDGATVRFGENGVNIEWPDDSPADT